MAKLNFKSMKETIYDLLRQRILTGFYAQDCRLNEEELAREFRVSRSPVREAIQLLVGNGLARSEPYRGVFVLGLSQKEVQDIYEFRILLENTCLTSGLSRFTAEDEVRLLDIRSKLRQAAEAYDMPTYVLADQELHHAMILSSKNSAIIAAYDRIAARLNPFRIFSLLGSERYQQSCQEHEDIIAALLAGDAATAMALNTTHLSKAKAIVESYIGDRKAFLAENAEHLAKIKYFVSEEDVPAL